MVPTKIKGPRPLSLRHPQISLALANQLGFRETLKGFARPSKSLVAKRARVHRGNLTFPHTKQPKKHCRSVDATNTEAQKIQLWHLTAGRGASVHFYVRAEKGSCPKFRKGHAVPMAEETPRTPKQRALGGSAGSPGHLLPPGEKRAQWAKLHDTMYLKGFFCSFLAWRRRNKSWQAVSNFHMLTPE